MQVDFEARTAALSVGEFARFFEPSPAIDAPTHTTWRMEASRIWHEDLRRQTSERQPSCQFEVEVHGVVSQHGWSFQLAGRIDQWDPIIHPPTLRELKTIDGKLPLPEEVTLEAWRHAWLQAATYAELLADCRPAEPRVGRIELVLVEIQTGLVRAHPMAGPSRQVFHDHAAAVASYLEARRTARVALLGGPLDPPFEAWRPGQMEGFHALSSAVASGRRTLFEAATGFGKTAMAIHQGLGALRAGSCDHVFYLTAKNSSQPTVFSEFIRQMQACAIPSDVALLRSRADHCLNTEVHCRPEACSWLAGQEERWPSALAGPAAESIHPAWEVAAAKLEGMRHRVCPYDLTLRMLQWRHCWLADFNYALSPGHAASLDVVVGYDKRRTFLIVDEAHQIPARVADAFGFSQHANDAAQVAGALDFGSVSASVRAAWSAWLDWIAGLRATAEISLPELTALREIISRLKESAIRSPPDSLTIGVAAERDFWGVVALDRLWTRLDSRYLLWAPKDQSLRVTLLDASTEIRDALEPFQRVILQSATLGPHAEFLEMVGWSRADVHSVVAEAPWRSSGYRVAVDTRADTRLAQRNRTLPQTAKAVADLRAASRGAIVAFLPSFTYAEELARETESRYPIRVALQPRNASAADLETFVDTSLVTHDALVLVLGSSLAEAVDILGGRVSHAIVVGPALPEVNPVQEAKLRHWSTLGREAAFRRTYLIPGMSRVNQAIGRLVRAPGQHTQVLLHCRRFADVRYASLLDRAYQFFETIETDADMERWLRGGGD